MLDVITGFVVFLVYCDCGCSVFGPYFVKLCLTVLFVVFLVWFLVLSYSCACIVTIWCSVSLFP